MIPTFPIFKPLELSDKDEITAHSHQYGHYSDYNFVSLWSWDTQGRALVSKLHGNFVLKFLDYDTLEPFYSFFGDQHVSETVYGLLHRASQELVIPELRLVPEANIITDREGMESDFEVIEDRNNFDYIFSTEAIAQLQGSGFADHRNLVNRFMKRYPHYTVSELNLRDPDVQQEIRRLTLLRGEIKGSDTSVVENELKAIIRHAELAHHHELLCLGIYVDKQLIAFSTNEVLGNNHAIAHFRKADTRFAGIYQFQEQQTAKALLERGCSYLNFEQDLGIPSLRKAKSSWQPVDFLKKYTIRHKNKTH